MHERDPRPCWPRLLRHRRASLYRARARVIVPRLMKVGVDARAPARRARRGPLHARAARRAGRRATPTTSGSRSSPAATGSRTVPPGVTLVRHRAARPRAVRRGRRRPAARASTGLLGGVDVVWLPAPAPLAVSAGVPLRPHRPRPLAGSAARSDFTPYERAWHRLARPRALAARRRAPSRADADAVAAEHRAGVGRRRDGRLARGSTGRSARRRAPRSTAARRTCSSSARSSRARRPTCSRPATPAPASAGSPPTSSSSATAGSRSPAPASATCRRSATTARWPRSTPARSRSSRRRGSRASACRRSRPPRYGTPGVVSDLPVFAETLGDGALRVTPGDAEALAEALLRDRDRRRRCARAWARRRAQARRALRPGRGRRARCTPSSRGAARVSFTIVIVLHDSARRPAPLLALDRAPPRPAAAGRRRRHRLARRRRRDRPRARGRRGDRARRQPRASGRPTTPASRTPRTT